MGIARPGEFPARTLPERGEPTPTVPLTRGTARAPAQVQFNFWTILQGVGAALTGGPQGILAGLTALRRAVTVIPGVGAIAAPVTIPDPIEREFQAAMEAAERAAVEGREVSVRRLEFSPGFVAVGPEGTQRVMVQTVIGPRTVDVPPSGVGLITAPTVREFREFAGAISAPTVSREVGDVTAPGAVGPGPTQVGGVVRAEQFETTLAGPEPTGTVETAPTTTTTEEPLRRGGIQAI